MKKILIIIFLFAIVAQAQKNLRSRRWFNNEDGKFYRTLAGYEKKDSVWVMKTDSTMEITEKEYFPYIDSTNTSNIMTFTFSYMVQ